MLGRWPGLISNHRAHLVAALVRLLLHRREVVLQCFLTLDTAVSNFADFVAVELGPLGSIVLVEEIDDEYGVNEVDEGVAHVAVVLEVNR